MGHNPRMTQPPSDDPYFRPPPPQRPYGEPYGSAPPPQGYPPPPPQGYPPPPAQPYGQPYGGQQQPAGAGWQPPQQQWPQQQWGQPTLGPGGVPLAGPGWRFLARLIDGFIVSLIATPLTVPIYLALFKHFVAKVKAAEDAAQAGAGAPPPNVIDGTTIKLELLLLGAVVLVSLLYEVPQLARWGQTLGKRVCGVRVVRQDGAPRLGFGSAILRWLGTNAGVLVPFAGGIYGMIDSLWLLWDKPWQQCLHDKFAKTVVVRRPS